MDRMEKPAQKMILARKTYRALPRGFTILELVIVLFIVALFAGSAMTLLVKSDNKEALNFEADFKNFVRDTKFYNIESKRTYYIFFDHERIWRSTEDSFQFEPSLEHIPIPPNTLVSVNKNDSWIKVKKGAPARWLFSSSGISEPFIVRFSLDKTLVEIDFDEIAANPRIVD